MSTTAEARTAARTAVVDGLEKLRAAFPLEARVRGASPAAQATYGGVLRAWLAARHRRRRDLPPTRWPNCSGTMRWLRNRRPWLLPVQRPQHRHRGAARGGTVNAMCAIDALAVARLAVRSPHRRAL